MVKTLVLLGVVLLGVCLCEATQAAKKHLSYKACCYPPNHSWKMVKRSKSSYTSSSDVENPNDPFRLLNRIASTTSVYESIEIIDGTTRFTSDSSGYTNLQFVTGDNITYVSYSPYSKCYDMYSYRYYSYGSSSSSPTCFYGYSCDETEELNGVTYSTFLIQSTSSYSTDYKKLYATENADGSCSPHYLIEKNEYKYSSNSTSSYSTATTYLNLENTEDVQRLLEAPPASELCRRN